jgi:hypothetical protein
MPEFQKRFLALMVASNLKTIGRLSISARNVGSPRRDHDRAALHHRKLGPNSKRKTSFIFCVLRRWPIGFRACRLASAP